MDETEGKGYVKLYLVETPDLAAEAAASIGCLATDALGNFAEIYPEDAVNELPEGTHEDEVDVVFTVGGRVYIEPTKVHLSEDGKTAWVAEEEYEKHF